MQNSEHLPIGHRLESLYKIVKVLGRDDFEIVYLVKDIHRMDDLVVKELFLKGSSFRDKTNVYTQEKSKKAFQTTKEGIIKEVNLLKDIKEANGLQTYGYFEENNTIYTLMEYRKNAPLESYLKIIPQKIVEPTPIEPTQAETDHQKPKSYFFLKLLITLIFIATALGAYAYKIMVYDREKAKEVPKVIVTEEPKTTYHPPLIDRNQSSKEIPKPKIEKAKKEASQQKEKSIIEDNSLPLNLPNDEIETETDINKNVKPKTSKELPQTDTKIKKQKIEKKVSVEVAKEPTIKTVLTTETTTPSQISLGTKINGTSLNTTTTTFTTEKVQTFLENFIASGERGSVEEIVNYYDTKVETYFSLSNVTHQTIYRDKTSYNRKWQKRSFQLLNFQIVKTYYINNIEYCDVKNRTKWRVSTQNSKTASGISNVFITIKNTPYGFKVKSIYSF